MAVNWKKVGIVGGALGLIYFFSRKANAAAAVVTAPATDKNAQLQQMSTILHDKLKAAGYTTVPAYVKPGESQTEEIVDTTGANRVLSSRNQGLTDTFHDFMWWYNAVFMFGHTDLLDTDPGKWAQLQQDYQTLLAGFTPQFLA